MQKTPPAYRRRKGTQLALVTLTDRVTKRRRDYRLGEYDSPASRERYQRVIAAWEANDRRWPDLIDDVREAAAGITVGEIIVAYWRWAKTQYSPAELSTIRTLLRQMDGTTPAAAFGPRRLRLLREAMIRGDADAEPPRRPWSRANINKQIHRVGAVFRWAAGHELLPISQYQQLKSIEPLKRGRCAARETEPVRPAPDWLIEAVRPHVSAAVWALIQLQRLTGARGGELFGLRPIDIDTSADIWACTLAEHKTAHHGKRRTQYFGPRAQEILRPFLQGRRVDAYLFSPAEAETERRAALSAARRTPRHHGNAPGAHRADNPRRMPGERFTRAAYHRAIQRGCDQAFPPPTHLARARVLGRGRKAQSTRWESDTE